MTDDYTPTTEIILAQWIKNRPEGVTEEQSLDAFGRWYVAEKAKFAVILAPQQIEDGARAMYVDESETIPEAWDHEREETREAYREGVRAAAEAMGLVVPS